MHGWNKVRLTLSTHSEGGLTDADHALARRIDELDERVVSTHVTASPLATLARVALMPDDEPSRSSGAPPRRSRSRA